MATYMWHYIIMIIINYNNYFLDIFLIINFFRCSYAEATRRPPTNGSVQEGHPHGSDTARQQQPPQCAQDGMHTHIVWTN